MSDNEREQTRRIPIDFDSWLKDDTALPIVPHVSELLTQAEIAKIVCETPRTLAEYKDEDK